MRIFFIGYMGSGKTQTGRLLAERMNLEFLDIDHLFEEKYRISISAFYKKYGEELFRTLEHKLLRDNLHHDNMVMSVGGGTPCFHDNIQLMNDHGITVYLKVPAEELYHRLSTSRKSRPMLYNKTDESLRTHIFNQVAERQLFYAQAKITVEEKGLDIGKLVEMISAFNK
ncbi:MAG: AAA family ATPase [Bacteroidetes bacterium]|nr:AAA family ATPase [Bacteroidota bacterium]